MHIDVPDFVFAAPKVEPESSLDIEDEDDLPPPPPPLATAKTAPRKQSGKWYFSYENVSLRLHPTSV